MNAPLEGKRLDPLRPLRLGRILLLCAALGCAHVPSASFSETWAYCEGECAALGRTLARTLESPDAIVCMCGHQIIQSTYRWPAIEHPLRYGPPPRKAKRAV